MLVSIRTISWSLRPGMDVHLLVSVGLLYQNQIITIRIIVYWWNAKMKITHQDLIIRYPAWSHKKFSSSGVVGALDPWVSEDTGKLVPSSHKRSELCSTILIPLQIQQRKSENRGGRSIESLYILEWVKKVLSQDKIIDNWNMLPASVVTAPSTESFKSRLNKHWPRRPSMFTASCYTPGQQISTGHNQDMHRNRLLNSLLKASGSR